ncbi:MAG: hypothetical protein K2L34_10475 [Muribaculaceae bacterium]|nr:hypothetical protein [Muribaculaceae bacterium]
MKRALLTLLIIFNLTVTANHTFAASNENDDTLKGALEALYEHCGSPQKSRQYANYSDYLQERYNIRSFNCDKDNSYLKKAMSVFEEESKNGYAFIYVEPKQEGSYDVKLRDETIPLRVNDELMWIISKKNPEDARLIDIYALSFSEDENGAVNGTVSLITKQRSDLLGDEIGSGANYDLLSDVVKDRKKKLVLEGWVTPDNNRKGELTAVLTEKLENYEYLLNQYRNEIAYINTLNNLSFDFRQEETKKLLNKLEGVTGNMETLIYDYINKSFKSDNANLSKAERASNLKGRIDAYQYLLNQYRNEIAYINTLNNLSFDFRQEESKKRLKKMEGVTGNMEKLINEYVEQIE